MKLAKSIIISFVLFAFLMSSLPIVAAIAEPEDDLVVRGLNWYFAAPTGGETVSGDYVVRFIGDYNGNPLYRCRIRVYQGRTLLTDYFEMTQVSSFEWQIVWDTTTFDDGDNYRLRVRAYVTARRSKEYYSEYVSIDNSGGGDTTPPTVDITNPADSATVSGTVSITADASDNVGVTNVQCRIDTGSWVDDTTSPYSWTWDTTQETDGLHDITCRAWDAAGNYADDVITVTVDNSGGGNELTSGETVYSSLSGTGDTEMWTIEVGPNCESMHSVLNCGSNDYDLYGRLGAEPTTSVYDWRGYTTGGEDVLYDYPGEGTWYIMVRSYSGSGPYDLTVTLTYGGEPDPWGSGGKYAIIVGISDYGYISDLSYCDEDATDWYDQLTSIGYECRVYGDGHSGNYPRYDGKATENVVRNAMQGLAAHAQTGDTVCFITSGHGSGNGAGSSYLCMWDCSGSAGCYYDTELAADVDQFASGVKVFVFIDHCYSGGMGPELMALSNSANIYCATTCTEDGYGYDAPTYQNGLWTYYFLDFSWQSHYGGDAGDAMETIFNYAHANYPYGGGDEPQEFDGSGTSFYL